MKHLQSLYSSLPFFMNKLYFYYSMIFIASRASATVLIASRIQSSSKYPLEVFRTLPTEGWNEELQRFLEQIKNQESALSAMGFFLVNKKLLFAASGALITYELVLLQFNGSEVDWDKLVDCNQTFEI